MTDPQARLYRDCLERLAVVAATMVFCDELVGDELARILRDLRAVAAMQPDPLPVWPRVRLSRYVM